LPVQIEKKFTTIHTISSIHLDANCNGGPSLVLTLLFFPAITACTVPSSSLFRSVTLPLSSQPSLSLTFTHCFTYLAHEFPHLSSTEINGKAFGNFTSFCFFTLFTFPPKATPICKSQHHLVEGKFKGVQLVIFPIQFYNAGSVLVLY